MSVSYRECVLGMKVYPAQGVLLNTARQRVLSKRKKKTPPKLAACDILNEFYIV